MSAGVGSMKAMTMLAVLAKHPRVKPKGWAILVPDLPTLGDVADHGGLLQYRAYKRSLKHGAA